MLQHRSSRLRGVLLVFAGLLPIVFYYTALYRLSLPVPILDDFNAILNFLGQQRALHGVLPRAVAIVQFQHGDYRWMLPHLLMAVQTALSGRPSFSLYIALGNLFMLPAAYLLWLHFFPTEPLARRLLLFLPVLYLLFQFSYVEMLDFASAGLQFLIFPFVLAGLHLLLRNGSMDFVWACGFALLACATAPQGFFLAPLGFMLLLRERKPPRLLAWCLIFCVAIFAYLYHYRPAPPAGAGPLWRSVLFFVSFTGGAIENMHREPIPYAAVLLGLLLCFTFLHSVRTRFYQTHPLFFLTSVWAYLTALLITYARHSFGLPQSLAARYKLFSSILVAVAYVYWIHRVQLRTDLAARARKRIYAGALTASMLFCLAADVVGYRFLQRRYDRTLEAYAFYREDPRRNAPYVNFYINGKTNDEAAFELDALQKAIRTGLYTPPVLPPPVLPQPVLPQPVLPNPRTP